MEKILFQILDKLGLTALYIILLTFLLIVLVTVVLFIHAYIKGREIKVGPVKIGKRSSTMPFSPSTPNKYKKRIMLLCSTTYEIARSKEKSNALLRFYKQLILELDRTPYGINTCGAEPLRKVIIDDYCNKLYSWSRDQINEIQDKVRWHFFRTDDVGLNYEPAIYTSMEASGLYERTMTEYTNSDLIIAFTGRSGLKEQVERLLKYHREGIHGIDFNRKPLVVLGWFGGAAKELLDESPYGLNNLIKSYEDLDPYTIQDFVIGNAPELLATRLADKIRNLLC